MSEQPRKIKKRPFTVEEDHQLMRYVQLNGPRNWNVIASQMGRTAKQCRERYTGHLAPHINTSPFTAEEDRIIVEKHALLGNKWAAIARYLPGRTDVLVKNRWSTRLRHMIETWSGPPFLAVQPVEEPELRRAILPSLIISTPPEGTK